MAEDAAESDAVLCRRAQILATEHWGLLAARGTAQSEVLTRITIFLTLVSAGLVTMGLLGQASGFSGWFSPAMLGILAFLAVIGLMTQLRVINVGGEDMMYVVAMNRLRGGYVDLPFEAIILPPPWLAEGPMRGLRTGVPVSPSASSSSSARKWTLPLTAACIVAPPISARVVVRPSASGAGGAVVVIAVPSWSTG